MFPPTRNLPRSQSRARTSTLRIGFRPSHTLRVALVAAALLFFAHVAEAQQNCIWTGVISGVTQGGSGTTYFPDTWGAPSNWTGCVGYPGEFAPVLNANVTIQNAGLFVSRGGDAILGTGIFSAVFPGDTSGSLIFDSIATPSILVLNISNSILMQTVSAQSAISSGTTLSSALTLVGAPSSFTNTNLDGGEIGFRQGAQATFTGGLQLGTNTAINGGTAGLLTVLNANVTGNGLLQEAGGGLLFSGVNTVGGIFFQGNASVVGTTTFTGTKLEGVLTAGDGGTINFTGTADTTGFGFTQSGTGVLNLAGFTGTGGTFTGSLHLSATNTLTNGIVTTGSTLSVDSGVTTFNGGTNNGLLAAAGGSLILSGVVDNTNGLVRQGTGQLTLQDVALTGGNLDDGGSFAGTNTLQSTNLHGTWSVTSGTTTITDSVSNGALNSGSGASLILSGNITAPVLGGPGALELSNGALQNASIKSSLGTDGTSSLRDTTLQATSLVVNSGVTTINDSLTTTGASSIQVASGASLVNAGTLQYASTLTISGAVDNTNGVIQKGASGGALTLSNASITGGHVNNVAAMTGTNTLQNLTLTGIANVTSGATTVNGVTNNGTVNVTGGSLILSGDIHVGTIVNTSGQAVQLNSATAHDGSITGAGVVANGVNTLSNLALGGTLEVASGRTTVLSGLTFSNNPGFLVSGGTLSLSTAVTSPMTVQSAGTLELNGTFAQSSVNSAGTLLATTGSTATLSSLSTTGGTLHAEQGSTMVLNNSTLMNTTFISDGSPQSGPCNLICPLPQGAFNATGLNTMFNTTFNGAPLTITSGTTSLLGNVYNAAITAAGGATLDLSGATIFNSALTTTGTGVVQVFGQNLMFASAPQGAYNISMNGALTLAGADWDVTTGSTTLIGKSGTLALTSGIVQNEGGTITVLDGGVLEVPQTFLQSSGNTTINGVLHAGSSAAPGTIDINGGTFTYGGAQDIFGNLDISGSAIGTITGDYDFFGSVTLNSFSTLTGDHAISGDLDNAGTVEAGDDPGTIDVAGNYSQSTGSLDIELGANASSQLNIAGQATLGGTLDLIDWEGFQPLNGQEFTIVTFAGYTGRFSGVLQSGFTDGAFEVIYDPGDVMVKFEATPTPEPSTWLLISSCCLLLGITSLRRRRVSRRSVQ